MEIQTPGGRICAVALGVGKEWNVPRGFAGRARAKDKYSSGLPCSCRFRKVNFGAECNTFWFESGSSTNALPVIHGHVKVDLVSEVQDPKFPFERQDFNLEFH